MGAIADGVRSLKERLTERKADHSAIKAERAKRKAASAARRNEYHRSHGGDHAGPRA